MAPCSLPSVEPQKVEIQPLVEPAVSVRDALADLRGPRFLPISERCFLGFLVIVRGVPVIDVSVLMAAESVNGAIFLFFEPEGLLSSGGTGRFELVAVVSPGWVGMGSCSPRVVGASCVSCKVVVVESMTSCGPAGSSVPSL